MKIQIIYQKRKSLTLKIQHQTLVVKAPIGIKQAIIQQFVEKHLLRIKQQIAMQQRFDIGENIYVFDQWVIYDKKTNYLNLLYEEIIKWVDFYQPHFQKQVKAIQLRQLTATWGNCKTDGRLTFSTRLLHTPKTFIQVVIAHEMCHLQEMNHSAKFYQQLYKICPNYKAMIKAFYQGELDQYKWSDNDLTELYRWLNREFS